MISIVLDDSIDHDLDMVSRPSVISAVRLPYGASAGTSVLYFQLPCKSTGIAIVFSTSPSSFNTVAVTVPPGSAVPETVTFSPLCTTRGMPPIVRGISLVVAILSCDSSILRLMLFSFPCWSFKIKSTRPAFWFSGTLELIIK